MYLAKATKSRVKRQIADQNDIYFCNQYYKELIFLIKSNYKFIKRPQPNKTTNRYMNRHFIDKESIYTNTVEYAKLH